jgi:hypothetical protein
MTGRKEERRTENSKGNEATAEQQRCDGKGHSAACRVERVGGTIPTPPSLFLPFFGALLTEHPPAQTGPAYHAIGIAMLAYL